MVTECNEDDRKKTYRIRGRKKRLLPQWRVKKKKSQTGCSELNNEQKAGVR